MDYDSGKVEKKWQARWRKSRLYEVDLPKAKRPYYNLMMFPYPSAEGLHVGNMYAFTGADIYGRYQRMKGYDVFEPIGLDGFGIHSENYAIKIGKHPAEQAKISEKNFYRQLSEIGNGFAWEHRLETYDSDYYRWTQWLFLTLFKAGLVYRGRARVNWCPACKTVLADEQVEEGACERCKTQVERREMKSWYFRITKYADRLLGNIDGADGRKGSGGELGRVGESWSAKKDGLRWPEKIKIAQRQWIGKKTGIDIEYEVEGTGEKVICFTTRPDTNYGATFVVLAPEHKLAGRVIRGEIKLAKETQAEVAAYVEKALKKSEQQRLAEGRRKTGVFTGLYAVNRLNGQRMPVWVSDFVLAGFGTGAVVGVPGHDRRDFEFAQAFGLPVKRVVVGPDGDNSPITRVEQVQEAAGKMINSEFLNGLEVQQAIERMMDYLEEKGWGKRSISYHLRDWLISRQRYWGVPIPMIYCEKCAQAGKSYLRERGKAGGIDWDDAGWYPVPESELPIELPQVQDYKPKGDGSSPLANAPASWRVARCPRCGGEARRELDVCDTFLDSSWYYLAYPNLKTRAWRAGPVPFDEKIMRRWLPVSAYIGGAEHAVLHLLYSRFVSLALHDLGYLKFEEPFPFLYSHGLIIKDGMKMSKSRGNVVNPDEYIRRYGADALRAYLMFIGPYNQGGDFRDTGMQGMRKFVDRLYRLLSRKLDLSEASGERLLAKLNWAVKRVIEGYESFRYNVAIAALMEVYNEAYALSREGKEAVEYRGVWAEFCRKLIKLAAPVMPYLAEELWAGLGESGSVHEQKMPVVEERYLREERVTVVVQVNGKKRGLIELSTADLPEDEEAAKKLLLAKLKEDERLAHYAESRFERVVYVPGKLVNLCVSA